MCAFLSGLFEYLYIIVHCSFLILVFPLSSCALSSSHMDVNPISLMVCSFPGHANMWPGNEARHI